MSQHLSRSVENDYPAALEAPAKTTGCRTGRTAQVQDPPGIDQHWRQPGHEAGCDTPVDEIRLIESCGRSIETPPEIPESDSACLRTHIETKHTGKYQRLRPGMPSCQSLVMNPGLLSLVLPRSCVVCGIGLKVGHFCRACEADLPWIDQGCERCGRPVAAPAYASTPCPDCQTRPPPFERAFAPLLYAFPVDSALKALKFQRQVFYAPAFGEILVPVVDESFPDADALLPVPLHPRRHATRGFNQATELCRPLAREYRMPEITNVYRTRFTKPQTGLDAAERRRNMKAAFKVRGELGYCRPLVVDDVITTGETCRQVARALLDAGAEKVSVLAVAHAVGT